MWNGYPQAPGFGFKSQQGAVWEAWPLVIGTVEGVWIALVAPMGPGSTVIAAVKFLKFEAERLQLG